MKKLLLASVSSLALSGLAHGADMAVPMAYKAPPPPVANWTGFYLGVDGGIARHEASFDDFDAFFQNALGGLNASFALSKTGGLAGGYAGFNIQERSFVYGIEADVNWIGAKATATWTEGQSIFNDSAVQSQDVPWLATFRGRMGLDFDSTMFYWTGGLAVANVKNSVTGNCAGCLPAGPIATFSEDTTRLGWTVGAGVEHMFASHWTIRGEVRYVDLGRGSVNCTDIVAGACQVPQNNYHGEFSNTLTSGLVGLGYKF